jgi:Zn-dependent protease
VDDKEVSNTVCAGCGAGIGAKELSCPNCQRLVHAEELKQLAAGAESLAQAGKLSDALVCWRTALDLLPPESRQHEIIWGKIQTLSKQVAATGGSVAPEQKSAPRKDSKLGVFGAIGAAVVFILSKAKLLLLGLSKAGTFFTMLLSFTVYWQLWGWMFAAGFVLSIYVHEMGHVVALRRYGIPATAPMFIPGFGAIVRIKQYPATPSEDAYVGLAGPVWGLGAACVTGALFLATNQPIFAALTHAGAFINLFNLLPIWQLDGGRGFRALSNPQRWFAALTIGAAWYLSSEGLLLILLVFAVLAALSKDAPKSPDRWALLKYVGLIAALSALIVNTAHLAPATGK